MLEAGKVLETYRLNLPPEKIQKLSSITAEAVKIFDHPLKFLSYEGSVNKGKGAVQIVDSGTYQLLTNKKNFRELMFKGKILKGRFNLIQYVGDIWDIMQV